MLAVALNSSTYLNSKEFNKFKDTPKFSPPAEVIPHSKFPNLFGNLIAAEMSTVSSVLEVAMSTSTAPDASLQLMPSSPYFPTKNYS